MNGWKAVAAVALRPNERSENPGHVPGFLFRIRDRAVYVICPRMWQVAGPRRPWMADEDKEKGL